jgi:unsaturated rhamnogalacturonyl hydrolase
MNKNLVFFACLLMVFLHNQHSCAETMTSNSSMESMTTYPDTSGFKSDSILKKAILVDDYIRLVKHPDYWNNTYVGKSRPSNIWTRGVFYEGHMALYYVYKDTAIYNYAYNWAKYHNWEMAYKSTTTTSADDQCCGQTYLELYNLKPSAEKYYYVKTCLDNSIKKSNRYWTWIDAIQMAMPAYALLGQITNDKKYFDYMYSSYKYTRDSLDVTGMFNISDGLWWRDKNFNTPYVNSNGKQVYWSRGNGWVYAALVRVLNIIPKTETHYNDYLKDYLLMSKSLLACQREDGFWNPSLADSNEYGGKETSGTSLFVYGMAWGLNNGILDRKTYLTAVEKGWSAMSRDAIHNNGIIGWMQGTADDPSDDQPLGYDKLPNFEDYGAGCVLLAAAESYKMALVLEKEDSIKTGLNDTENYRKLVVTSDGHEVNIINAGKSFLQIFNSSGQMIDRGEIKDDGPYKINSSLWNRGIYIVKVYGKKGLSIVKFSK